MLIYLRSILPNFILVRFEMTEPFCRGSVAATTTTTTTTINQDE